jgi:hypothetical protein
MKSFPELAYAPAKTAAKEYLWNIDISRLPTADYLRQIGDLALRAAAPTNIVSTPIAAHQEANPGLPLEYTAPYRASTVYAEQASQGQDIGIVFGLNYPPDSDSKWIKHTEEALGQAQEDFPDLNMHVVDMGEFKNGTIGQLRDLLFNTILRAYLDQASYKLSELMMHNRDIDIEAMTALFFDAVREERDKQDLSGLRIATTRLQHTVETDQPIMAKFIGIYDLNMELLENSCYYSLNDNTSAWGVNAWTMRNGINPRRRFLEIHDFVDRFAAPDLSIPIVVPQAISTYSGRRYRNYPWENVGEEDRIDFWEHGFAQTESYRSERLTKSTDLPYEVADIALSKVLDDYLIFYQIKDMKRAFSEARDDAQRDLLFEHFLWRISMIRIRLGRLEISPDVIEETCDPINGWLCNLYEKRVG